MFLVVLMMLVFHGPSFHFMYNERIFLCQVTAKDLNDQKSFDKQYVYLKASSNTPGFQFNNEIKILVSYRNAMVFIQTDKPIYNPGQVGML